MVFLTNFAFINAKRMIKAHTINRFLTLFIFFLYALVSNAQVFEGDLANKKLKGADLVKVSEQTGLIQYAQLNENIRINEANVQAYLQKVYELSNAYTFSILRKESDELGFYTFVIN